MTNPYSDLPARAFWRSGVTLRDALDPGDLYQPKFAITRDMRVMTAGSCFAQHVGRTLRKAGFNVLDNEPLPDTVPDAVANRFGYRLYSARYGNIYTVRQLMQLFRECRGRAEIALPVWEKDGRFFDSQRPSVEPDGLDSPELVHEHREKHLLAVRRAFNRCDLMVFTLGLTEAWIHRETGTVYPTAPGTIAGTFDPEVFAFKNYTFEEIIRDFRTFRAAMKRRNPDLKFLVTTSPVPLTATASGQHVEVATAYSKATLRSVCGALYQEFDDVEYFPSYEVITSANNRMAYFEANKRSVSPEGVAKAMHMFLAAHDEEAAAAIAPEAAGEGAAPAEKPAARPRRKAGEAARTRVGKAAGKKAAGRKAGGKKQLVNAEDIQDEICEDVLLEAFSK